MNLRICNNWRNEEELSLASWRRRQQCLVLSSRTNFGPPLSSLIVWLIVSHTENAELYVYIFGLGWTRNWKKHRRCELFLQCCFLTSAPGIGLIFGLGCWQNAESPIACWESNNAVGFLVLVFVLKSTCLRHSLDWTRFWKTPKNTPSVPLLMENAVEKAVHYVDLHPNFYICWSWLTMESVVLRNLLFLVVYGIGCCMEFFVGIALAPAALSWWSTESFCLGCSLLVGIDGIAWSTCWNLLVPCANKIGQSIVRNSTKRTLTPLWN